MKKKIIIFLFSFHIGIDMTFFLNYLNDTYAFCQPCKYFVGLIINFVSALTTRTKTELKDQNETFQNIKTKMKTPP